jgi:hypothetical protein
VESKKDIKLKKKLQEIPNAVLKRLIEEVRLESQELKKFIKECKSLVKSNVPEMVRKVKEYKV